MGRRALAVGLVVMIWPAGGFAAGTEQVALNDQQKMGRMIYEQSCGVCHTKPTLISGTYGPFLSKQSLGGQDDVMREVISNGTPRMPGFKHYLKPEQIDALVAFIKTMPVPDQEHAAPAVAPERAPRVQD